jgi:hypothetical protein
MFCSIGSQFGDLLIRFESKTARLADADAELAHLGRALRDREETIEAERDAKNRLADELAARASNFPPFGFLPWFFVFLVRLPASAWLFEAFRSTYRLAYWA